MRSILDQTPVASHSPWKSVKKELPTEEPRFVIQAHKKSSSRSSYGSMWLVHLGKYLLSSHVILLSVTDRVSYTLFKGSARFQIKGKQQMHQS